jgi:hypothetical protein
MTAGAEANGVTYNPATGDFSGYAWSDNIGWVSFNRADTGNPPAAPNNSGSGPIAKYDLSTGNITGWMRVLSVCDSVPCATSGAGSNSGGWDGWIRFCDSTMANCNASNQIAHLNPATGSLSGWAWSDSVVGWLMLGSNSNNPPTATNLNYAEPDYCTLPPIGTFSWTFSDPDAGDKQSAYEVQVDNNSDFSSPEVDSCPTPGTGSCSPGHGSNTFSPASAIPYNSAYYWRVKVWDSNGADSGWIQYNNPADPDGDGNAKTFTVPKHAYPSVTDISWTPANPSAGESVTFSAMTVCYATGGGTVVCPTAGYHWTFSGGNPGVVDGNVAPQVTFPTSGSVNASLKIVDADGYGASCSAPQLTKGFTVQLPLPGWKEVPPQ